ncbi:peroxiredoxin family protein [Zoogloea sp.]|uniref:peroxiredoxin family protein n=1 Tax=Zoogloea sp. TaxID=49181 RepID=UPI0035B0D705
MTMFSKLIRGVAALALVAALAGCGQQSAPDARFTTLDGQSVQLSSYKGKVVLVNFWATTCTTCVAEMPKLVEIHQRLAAKGYATVAIAMDYDPPEYVRNYASKNGLPFTVGLDQGGAAAKSFEDVRLTPTSFLIDRQGHIVQKYLGAPDFPKFEALVEKLLADPA